MRTINERVIEVEDASFVLETRIGGVIGVGTDVFEVTSERYAEEAITFKDEKQSKKFFVRQIQPMRRGR